MITYLNRLDGALAAIAHEDLFPLGYAVPAEVLGALGPRADLPGVRQGRVVLRE
jgi:hypothetical protein